MARESAFVKRLLKHLRDKGAFAFKLHGSMFQMAGLPDVVGCYQGFFFGFECKRPGNTASKLQEYVGRQIVQAGGLFGVIETTAEADGLLATLPERISPEKQSD
jgi:hypothetical protein